MSDISHTDGSYSLTATHFWCPQCRRQFSQLNIDHLPQVPCPRCNNPAQELPPNVHPPGFEFNNARQNGSSFAGPTLVFTQAFVDPSGRVFIRTTSIPTIITPVDHPEAGTLNAQHEDAQHMHHEGDENFQQTFGGAFDPLIGLLHGFGIGPVFDERLIEEFLRLNPHLNGPPPAPEEAINRLEVIRFDVNCQENELTRCPVCQEDYMQDESLVKLPCNHEYHNDCVKAWLTRHNSCPMCRKAI